jgi:hypothetical protein
VTCAAFLAPARRQFLRRWAPARGERSADLAEPAVPNRDSDGDGDRNGDVGMIGGDPVHPQPQVGRVLRKGPVRPRQAHAVSAGPQGGRRSRCRRCRHAPSSRPSARRRRNRSVPHRVISRAGNDQIFVNLHHTGVAGDLTEPALMLHLHELLSRGTVLTARPTTGRGLRSWRGPADRHPILASVRSGQGRAGRSGSSAERAGGAGATDRRRSWRRW